MKIGILGGSFNPIHNGHLSLCNQCNDIFNFDEILIIPSNIPPHKSNDEFVTNQDRLNMIDIALQKQKHIKCSKIEFEIGGISYTYNTLKALQKLYPLKTEFNFIIGSDMLEIFHKWYNYGLILKQANIIVGARKDDDYNNLLAIKKEKFNNNQNIKIVNIDILELSSTQIRAQIKQRIFDKNLLPSGVYEYILENNLYV